MNNTKGFYASENQSIELDLSPFHNSSKMCKNDPNRYVRVLALLAMLIAVPERWIGQIIDIKKIGSEVSNIDGFEWVSSCLEDDGRRPPTLKEISSILQEF